jgi:hypothetical protein
MWPLCLALLVFDGSATDRHARMIERLVLRGDAAAVDYVVRRVRDGMPPAALEAFLDAARAAPRPEFVPSLRALTHYRKETIRARAFAAIAALGDDYGVEAALGAMDDPSLSIRLLGLKLAEQHTSPRTEEAAILLLDRDAEVAEIVRRARARK